MVVSYNGETYGIGAGQDDDYKDKKCGDMLHKHEIAGDCKKGRCRRCDCLNFCSSALLEGSY